MLNKEKILYSLREVTIIPSVNPVGIEHRAECDIRTNSIEGVPGYLPLIAAPMSSVISPGNYNKFHEAGISCIIPRTVPINERLRLCTEVMCAFSLKEVEDNFLNNRFTLLGTKLHVLIDIANGHMKKELLLGEQLKDIYKDNIILMGGNIANPEIYGAYCDSGFDYIRLGIGGGAGCITSTQSGVHYPMASLISETYELGYHYDYRTKIVADGGINSYSDAIKCLALGADYVMMGKVFAKSKEACGETYNMYDEKGDLKTYRHYYGMSTKKAQAEILGYNTIEDAKKENIKLKTSEGRSVDVLVEYSLSGWVENFTSYIRSAMSYTGHLNLEDFKESEVAVMSPTSEMLINSK